MTGDGRRDGDGEGAMAFVSRSQESSADSLLREVAQAPGLTPAPDSEASASAFRLVLAAGIVLGGRFRLERRMGEGGMGVVWAAVHTVTRRPVALKFLKRTGHDDARAVQRFLREARAASAVRHPNVVEIHDVLELEDGSPVMVMELLIGETLAHRLGREGAIPLPELARILMHVGTAMACAHALGIVHRDLKPENIFLLESVSGPAVKVLDFGIAKLTASEGDAVRTDAITGTGAVVGTPYYMAPEQVFGEKDIDRRADIWALGIILYEGLTGQRPTGGENVGQIYKVIMTDSIVPLGERAPDLPAAVVDLVGRMLSRNRADRPSDMGEILGVLAPYAGVTFDPALLPGFPVLPSSPGGARARAVAPLPGADDAAPNRSSGLEVPSRTNPSARRRSMLAVVAVVASAALGLGVFRTWPRMRERSITPTPAAASPAALPGTPTPAALPGAPTPAASPAALPEPPAVLVAEPSAMPAEPRTPKASPPVKRARPAPTAAASASVVAAPAATVTIDPGSYQ